MGGLYLPAPLVQDALKEDKSGSPKRILDIGEPIKPLIVHAVKGLTSSPKGCGTAVWYDPPNFSPVTLIRMRSTTGQ